VSQVFRSLKSAVKRRFPGLVPAYGAVYRHLVLQPRLRRMSAAEVFETIYRTRGWEGIESPSGRGSTLTETTVVREALPQLVADFDILSMLDIPCGDGHWMVQVAMHLERYVGADIVEDLVADCRARWPKSTSSVAEFIRLDLINDRLPQVDLVFCRDCLVHLSFANAIKALENIKASRSSYLLTTTFPGRRNSDIATGEWRVIDLQAKPFRFPPPLRIFNEHCVDPPGYSDKSMGLWRIADLPNFDKAVNPRTAMKRYLFGAVSRAFAAKTAGGRKNSAQTR
jgi:hypothetical protein